MLADELRSLVMEEAFGIASMKFSDSFEWDVLRYPTSNSDTAQKPIKNLEQLKRINIEEKRLNVISDVELDESMDTEVEDEAGVSGNFLLE